MATRIYRYSGLSYPPETGIMLPGVNAPVFPHRMDDVDIALLLNQFPHLRRYWESGIFDEDGGGNGGGGGGGNGGGGGGGNGGGGSNPFDEELKFLLEELTSQSSSLQFI